MMMRARLACGCMMPTHCWVSSLRPTGGEGEVELAGLDLGKVEQVVEQRDQMRSGDVDVLEIVAVALVADRAEVLGHDHLGETGDGVERRADLVADLGEEIRLFGCRLVRLALGRPQLFLGLVQGLKPGLEFADLALGGIERGRDRAALLLHLAAGEDQRECGAVAPGNGEQAALDRDAVAAPGCEQQRPCGPARRERSGAGVGKERSQAAGRRQRARFSWPLHSRKRRLA